MEERKLVIIGAGSAMFTEGLVSDLLSAPMDFKWHISLVDIDEPVLISMAKLVRKMIMYKNSSATLSYSTDRREELPNADYVVATIGVGGRRAWEQDVFIPRKYGIMQPVGDTAMPGGISRALRMAPAMVDISRDVAAICPKAVFINYSNPMAVLCKAVKKAVGTPMTGLCIGVAESVWHIAETAGLPKEECTALWGGINHCTFIYDFRYRGKKAWPEASKGQQSANPFAWWFLENQGAYLAPGDRHVTEFFTEYFPGGNYYGHVLGKDAFSFEGTIQMGDEIHQKAMEIAQSDGSLPESFFQRLSGEQEQLIDIIQSIEYDQNKIFSANITNNGTLPGINPDAVVEVPCAVGAHGFSALAQPCFPAVFAAHTNRFLACVDLTAEAALTGSRQLFIQAMLMGGYLNDRGVAEKMAEELLAAHKDYLPQF